MFENFLPTLAQVLPGLMQGGMPNMAGGGFAGPMDDGYLLPDSYAAASPGVRAAFDEVQQDDPNIRTFADFLALQRQGRQENNDPLGVGQLIPGMGGLEQSLAQNRQRGQQMRQQQRPPGTPGKFMNALGLIGDALAQWRGGQPLYAQRLAYQQQQAREQGVTDALKNYLTDPEGAIAALMQVDPRTGIQLAQSRQKQHSDLYNELSDFGIDPHSEQGQAIVRSRYMKEGADPTFVRELEALGIDPHSQEALELYYGRNSPAGYLLKPGQRSSGPPSLTPGKIVNGFRFKGGNPNDKANWEAVGGPTPQASGPFPQP